MRGRTPIQRAAPHRDPVTCRSGRWTCKLLRAFASDPQVCAEERRVSRAAGWLERAGRQGLCFSGSFRRCGVAMGTLLWRMPGDLGSEARLVHTLLLLSSPGEEGCPACHPPALPLWGPRLDPYGPTTSTSILGALQTAVQVWEGVCTSLSLFFLWQSRLPQRLVATSAVFMGAKPPTLLLAAPSSLSSTSPSAGDPLVPWTASSASTREVGQVPADGGERRPEPRGSRHHLALRVDSGTRRTCGRTLPADPAPPCPAPPAAVCHARHWPLSILTLGLAQLPWPSHQGLPVFGAHPRLLHLCWQPQGSRRPPPRPHSCLSTGSPLWRPAPPGALPFPSVHAMVGGP